MKKIMIKILKRLTTILAIIIILGFIIYYWNWIWVNYKINSILNNHVQLVSLTGIKDDFPIKHITAEIKIGDSSDIVFRNITRASFYDTPKIQIIKLNGWNIDIETYFNDGLVKFKGEPKAYHSYKIFEVGKESMLSNVFKFEIKNIQNLIDHLYEINTYLNDSIPIYPSFKLRYFKEYPYIIYKYKNKNEFNIFNNLHKEEILNDLIKKNTLSHTSIDSVRKYILHSQ